MAQHDIDLFLREDAIADAPSIAAIIEQYTAKRAISVNLVASENRMSPAALSALQSDLAHRYAIPARENRPKDIWDYPNQTLLRHLEAEVQRLACQLFGGKAANVRPLSGNNVAGIVLASLVPPGGKVLAIPGWAGGHFATKPLCDRLAVAHVDLPYDRNTRQLDLAACHGMAQASRFDLIYLDASMMLEPHPVSALRRIFGPDTPIVYDASHVFGLIAGGTFQDPFAEGADLMVGSTHKSLFGPQKGMIIAREAECRLMRRIECTVTPLFVSNPHVHHIAALGIALEELSLFGANYAAAIVRNARLFAAELKTHGIRLLAGADGRPCSHQVFVVLEAIGAEEAVQLLEATSIHVNGVRLPFLEQDGLRIGISEITRLGYSRDEICRLAGIFAGTLQKRLEVGESRNAVAEIALRRQSVFYTFDKPSPVSGPSLTTGMV